MDFFDENGNHIPDESEIFTPEYRQRIIANLKTLKEQSHPMIPMSALIGGSSPISSYLDTIHNIVGLTRKSSRSRIKKDLVFVWDIEEITILTRNYIIEYMARFPRYNWTLFRVMIDRILKIADFDELNEGKIVNIEDAGDDARLVPKYNALRKFYDEISDGFREDGPIINYELVEKCGLASQAVQLYVDAEEFQYYFNNRWKSVRKCLKLVNESNTNHENVVLCGDEIGHAAAQLLITGSAQEIPIENLYSTLNASKKSVFERIQRRFGENFVLVYITSNPESASIPENLEIPIWTIVANDSFESLYDAQRNILLR